MFRCGLWASSGPFPLSAHYGLYKRGRDPPTNPSRHLKKERSDLPLKWLLKEEQGGRPTAASAAATAAVPAAEAAASPCFVPKLSSCSPPAAAAAAAARSPHHHLPLLHSLHFRQPSPSSPCHHHQSAFDQIPHRHPHCLPDFSCICIPTPSPISYFSLPLSATASPSHLLHCRLFLPRSVNLPLSRFPGRSVFPPTNPINDIRSTPPL